VQDGLALLTRVKASPATRYLPIVIATADEPSAVVTHALALGADDVFVLPIADAELQARTRALARLAAIEIERRRRDALLAHFGVPRIPESHPACPRSTVSASC
jgi:two-component system, cell cycle response regulator